MICNCNPWNSLELIKVIILIITPIIGGIIAWRLAKVGKDLEKKQWSSRKIIEKRLDFYDKVVPELNDLYC
jgi:phosphate/sulfate permease